MHVCWRRAAEIWTLFSVLILIVTKYTQGLRVSGCSGERLQLGCSGNKVIVPQNANYGRTSRYVCPEPGGVSSATCLHPSSLSIVNVLCFGVKSCDIYVNATTFQSDPCPATTKYLDLEYDCVEQKLIFNICKHRFIVEDKGYLMSPNYPFESYESNTCSIRLKVKHTKYTFLEVLDVHLPSRTEVCQDYISIKSEFNTWQRYNFCHSLVRSTPPLMMSLQGTFVEYTSHGRMSHRGFLLRFDVTANHTVNNRDAERLQSRLPSSEEAPPLVPASLAVTSKGKLPSPEDLAKILDPNDDSTQRSHILEKLAEKLDLDLAQLIEQAKLVIRTKGDSVIHFGAKDGDAGGGGGVTPVIDLRKGFAKQYVRKNTEAVQIPNHVVPAANQDEGLARVIFNNVDSGIGRREILAPANDQRGLLAGGFDTDGAHDQKDNGHGPPAMPQLRNAPPEIIPRDDEPPDGCTERVARKLVPMHGMLVKYTPGKLVQVGCVPSMKLADEDDAVFLCYRNRWIGGIPKCIPAMCRVLTSIPHGDVVVQDRKEGGQAEYTCSSGFRLKGESTRTCLANAHWSGSEPSCVPRKSGSGTGSGGLLRAQIPIQIPLAIAFTLAFFIIRKRFSRLPSMVLRGTKHY